MNTFTKEKKLLLHLSLIKGVGSKTITKILHTTGTHFSDLYQYSKRDFESRFSFSSQLSQTIFNGLHDKKLLDQEIALIDKYKISVVTILDDDYPKTLKEIHLPPPVLYCKGASLKKEAKRVAFVGARKADHYAQKFIDTSIPDLIKNEWEIVSGGARGADSMAHKKTLDGKGVTLVVFGSGLLCPYPAENKELFRDVIKNGGTLISAVSLQTPPSQGLFPARNRVIAGLTQGTVVVQAAKRSGALITAGYALDEGRQVFSVPGAIDNVLSEGCHNLIKEGAKLTTSSHDIFEEFGESFSSVFSENKTEKIKEEDDHPLLHHLSQPQTTDSLYSATNYSHEELVALLFDLQLLEKIKQNPVGLWERL